MARRNPDVDRLEKHVAFLQGMIDRMRKDPGDVPILACGHSCVCATAIGIATNGPCSCDERKLRRAVKFWRGVAQTRQAIIQDMRNDYARGWADAERAAQRDEARSVEDQLRQASDDSSAASLLYQSTEFTVVTEHGGEAKLKT